MVSLAKQLRREVARMLTSKELSKKKGVQIRTIYNWTKDGCPHDYTWKGRKKVLVFDEKEVNKWLKSKK